MSVTIRPAVEADRAEIESMVRAARLNPRNLHWNRFLVAEEKGRIVGVRQVKVHSSGTREVASGWSLQVIGDEASAPNSCARCLPGNAGRST